MQYSVFFLFFFYIFDRKTTASNVAICNLSLQGIGIKLQVFEDVKMQNRKILCTSVLQGRWVEAGVKYAVGCEKTHWTMQKHIYLQHFDTGPSSG